MPKARIPANHPALQGFAERLIEVRKSRGISQERLAIQTGIARSYLSGIERGLHNLSLVHIVRLAETLNVDPWHLLEPVGSSIPHSDADNA